MYFYVVDRTVCSTNYTINCVYEILFNVYQITQRHPPLHPNQLLFKHQSFTSVITPNRHSNHRQPHASIFAQSTPPSLRTVYQRRVTLDNHRSIYIYRIPPRWFPSSMYVTKLAISASERVMCAFGVLAPPQNTQIQSIESLVEP